MLERLLEKRLALGVNKVSLADSAIDADVIAEIYKLCFHDPLNGDSIRDILCKEKCFALLGREETHIAPAGFVVCRVIAEESELLWLGVRPKKQREGWARILMLKALQEALCRGARSMVLEVAENNLPARHLYESLGFKIVGHRPSYYGQPIAGSSEAKIMRAVLGKLSGEKGLSY